MRQILFGTLQQVGTQMHMCSMLVYILCLVLFVSVREPKIPKAITSGAMAWCAHRLHRRGAEHRQSVVLRSAG